ncbi:MAG TPA: hypothetical protein VH814_16755 [Steroidobacteraceae bacterium]|jgi:hypothetical protein
MKTQALILGLLLLTTAWAADAYQLPSMLEVTGASCGAAQPYQTQFVITSTSDDGISVGRVWRYTRCSSGGRGTTPNVYTGCADVRWMPDGTMQGFGIVWRSKGKVSVPASNCIRS